LDGDTQILATLLKLIPGCIDAADIELLLQGIPVQPPVVIPARSMQEAIQAEDMPPLDVDAANVFSKTERIIQEHVRQHDINATVVKDLIQKVIHHRDFNADMHQRLMQSRMVTLKSSTCGRKEMEFKTSLLSSGKWRRF
jgi:hypothetical protein